MALVTSELQGSYKGIPSRPLSPNIGLALKPQFISFKSLGKSERFATSKRHFCLRVRSPQVSFPYVRSLRISSFKGSAQNEVSRGSPAKVSQNSMKYVPRQNEEIIFESPKAHEIPISRPLETNGNKVAGSPAIHRLFRKWLTMLTTQSSDEVAGNILGGESPKEIAEVDSEAQVTETNGIPKTLWCYFWGLDATIKISMLIFIPLYLSVNVVYGKEVSKELTPLWVLGPLLVALYVKMLQGLCSLYVFTFKLTAKVIKNLPLYYLVAYKYVFHGKLKEDIKALFWQPFVDLKNLDYNELCRRKLGEFQVWLMEKYLDYVESIWPYYCRTIRFLKRANLI